MSRLAALLAGAALFVPLLGAAGADPVGSSAEERADWVGRIREAHHAVARARAQHERAVEDYGRMRSRNKARGERRVEIRERVRRTEEERETAERQLEQLLEQARRAGVPPGWVREATGPGPASRD